MRYHFTTQAQLALTNAKQIAKECMNSYIGTEHLLLGIVKIEESTLARILNKMSISYELLYEDVSSLFAFNKELNAKMEYTWSMDEILQQCLIESYKNTKKLVDLDCLTKCLLNDEDNVAAELLRRLDVDIASLKAELSGEKADKLSGFKELRNLNQLQQDTPTKIVKRENEIELMIDILCRKQKANPLLIGEAGVGKSALVEELARRITVNEVPNELSKCILYELNLNNLVSGTKYRGEFEEKIEKLLDAILDNPNIILFIDEIHMMINAGKAEGSIDVAGVLKPYLARGHFRCIGATTVDEYNESIEKDKALKRRFQVLHVFEPNLSDVKEMILCKKEEYERHHHVVFPDNLIDECITLCEQYLPHFAYPDKAIDVLDLSCVQAKKLNMSSVNKSCIEDVIYKLSNIELDLSNKLMKSVEEINKLVTKENQDKIRYRIKLLGNNRKPNAPIDVWYLQGNDSENKLKIANILALGLLNQSKKLVVFDGLFMNVNYIEQMIKMCKKEPFQVIYFMNYHKMNQEIKYLISSALSYGKVSLLNYELDLTHSLILIDENIVKNKHIGFINEIINENNNAFRITLNQLVK